MKIIAIPFECHKNLRGRIVFKLIRIAIRKLKLQPATYSEYMRICDGLDCLALNGITTSELLSPHSIGKKLQLVAVKGLEAAGVMVKCDEQKDISSISSEDILSLCEWL